MIAYKFPPRFGERSSTTAHKATEEELDLLIKSVKTIADTFPDYVYNTDLDNGIYQPTRQNPIGCLIGAALRDVGMGHLAREGHPIDALLGYPPGKRDYGKEKYLVEKAQYLADVQSLSDIGTPWKTAVNEAYVETHRQSQWDVLLNHQHIDRGN